MTATAAVINPYEIFLGLDGLPLTGGKVYIGVAGQDPETNPIAVYSDHALTTAFPGGQPIRTVGGYLAASGTPATAYVGAYSYSLRVRNALNVVVYYNANVTDYLGQIVGELASATGSTLIGYKSPLSLTQATTVGAELARVIYLDNIQGVVGDGVHDDAPSIQAFIEANWGTIAGGQNLKYVEIHGTRGKTYKFSTVLKVRQARIRFIGNGATITCATTEAFYFTPETVPSFVESCAVNGWKITGATFAAVRCDPGAPFLEMLDCEVSGCFNGFYGCIVGAVIDSYFHDNTGKAVSLIAHQDGGVGVYYESQACKIRGRIYHNTQGGIYLENGGDHDIAADVEDNSTVNPEILNRNSFANKYIGMNSEPSAGAAAYYYSDDVSVLVPGRVTEGVQHIGGSLGGGATYDFQIIDGSYTTLMGIRGGTLNIYVGATAGNTLRFGLMASNYSVVGPGAATAVNIDQMTFQGSLRAHAGQAFYVGIKQVVGDQQAAIPNVAAGGTVDANARATLNALLVACRAHGLIAP